MWSLVVKFFFYDEFSWGKGAIAGRIRLVIMHERMLCCCKSKVNRNEVPPTNRSCVHDNRPPASIAFIAQTPWINAIFSWANEPFITGSHILFVISFPLRNLRRCSFQFSIVKPDKADMLNFVNDHIERYIY